MEINKIDIQGHCGSACLSHFTHLMRITRLSLKHFSLYSKADMQVLVLFLCL